jgi:hypothetical protein
MIYNENGMVVSKSLGADLIEEYYTSDFRDHLRRVTAGISGTTVKDPECLSLHLGAPLAARDSASGFRPRSSPSRPSTF